MHTLFWNFFKKFFKKKFILHLFPLGRVKLSGVFEDFFILQKTPSLIWTKGAKMHTHFEVFHEKFFKKKFILHLFGIGVSKRNLFQRKIFEKEQKNLPAGSGEQGILAFLLFEYQRKNF